MHIQIGGVTGFKTTFLARTRTYHSEAVVVRVRASTPFFALPALGFPPFSLR